MFDAVKFLVDIMVRAVSTLGKKRDDRTYNQLGVQLYRIYFRFNNMSIRGAEILGCIKDFIAQGIDESDSGESNGEVHSLQVRIIQLMQDQIETLDELHDIMDRLGDQFQVLNGDAYYRLVVQITGKGDSVYSVLKRILKDGLAPTVSIDDVLGGRRALSRFDRPGDLDIREIYGSLRSGAINYLVPWGTETKDLLRRQLGQGAWESQLQEIRSALECYRNSLEESFTMSEVLRLVAARGPRWLG